MATLPELKKKLRSIKSTEKMTKAMKTVSAAKYSKLNRLFGEYSQYSDSCFEVYKKFEEDINSYFPSSSRNAPPALFVFSSNKGMCGGFNTEIFSFTAEKLTSLPENTLVFPCGKRAVNYFTEKKLPFTKSFIFSDTPEEAQAEDFLDEILSLRKSGKISSVYFIYPKYKNVMMQIPTITELFTVQTSKTEEKEASDELFIPDKATVMKEIAKKVIFSAVFGIILETALGAQAATLTTMRSAYDTAVSYSAMLDIQINRKRQSEVTADVIETSQG